VQKASAMIVAAQAEAAEAGAAMLQAGEMQSMPPLRAPLFKEWSIR